MDDNPLEASIATAIESETALLLVNIDSALRSLQKAARAADELESLESLESALHTYGSVKHLLPKLHLSAGQRAPVEKQLQKLRAQIVAHSLYDDR